MLFNIFLTNQCNFKCEYCYEGNRDNEKEHFSDDNVPYLVSYAERFSPEDRRLRVNFHGGEPLLKFDLIKKIVTEFEKIRSCSFSLTTNGLLLTEEMIAFFHARQFFISVSLDGTKDVFYRHRKNKLERDIFDSIICKIKLLSRTNIYIRYRMTVTPDTVECLGESIKFIISLDARTIIVVPDYMSEQWNDLKINTFKEHIQESMKYIETNDLNVTIAHPITSNNLGICHGGKSEITINVAGDIFPCSFVCNDDNYKIGSLQTGIDWETLSFLDEEQRKHKKNCALCNFHERCIAERCIYLNPTSVSKVLCDFRKAFDEQENKVSDYR